METSIWLSLLGPSSIPHGLVSKAVFLEPNQCAPFEPPCWYWVPCPTPAIANFSLSNSVRPETLAGQVLTSLLLSWLMLANAKPLMVTLGSFPFPARVNVATLWLKPEISWEGQRPKILPGGIHWMQKEPALLPDNHIAWSRWRQQQNWRAR